MRIKFNATFVLLLTAYLFIGSCTVLTPEGAKVMVISNPIELKGRCKKLGPVSGYGPQENLSDALAQAEIEVRNAAAKKGANYVQITRKAEKFFPPGAEIDGIAYYCETGSNAVIVDDSALNLQKNKNYGSDTTSHLKWTLKDHFMDRDISQGDKYFSSENIETLPANKKSEYFKVVDIGKNFRLGVHIYPVKNPEDFKGFAFVLIKMGHKCKSWEWFSVQSDSIATKIQGEGKISFTLKQDSSGWVLSTIKVISGFSLRCKDIKNVKANVMGAGSAGGPFRWSCSLLSDSQIILLQ